MRHALIIPACGLSTRFPNMRPKWLLTHPTGGSMLENSIKGLDLSEVSQIYIVILKTHLDKYGSKFVDRLTNSKTQFVVLDYQTASQVETVAETIKLKQIISPITIKDTDNYFVSKIKTGNYVHCYDLNRIKKVNPGNKSYVKNKAGVITDIKEKEIVSSIFCCGAYSFDDAREFLKYSKDQTYISGVIKKMVADNHTFRIIQTSNYLDWGTLSDWEEYRSQFACLFVDIDGVLVENGGVFTRPYFWEQNPLVENIKTINEKYLSGKFHIIITTARPSTLARETESQLKEFGVKYHRILYDLPHVKRIIINDYSKSNPYQSCEAINLPRNSDTLKDLLR